MAGKRHCSDKLLAAGRRKLEGEGEELAVSMARVPVMARILGGGPCHLLRIVPEATLQSKR